MLRAHGPGARGPYPRAGASAPAREFGALLTVRLPLLLCILLVAAAPLPLQAGALPGPGTLIERARESDLARAPRWRALLHHERTLLGSRSAARGPHFFLSPRGDRDPAAELEATLLALLDPDARVGDRPPACAFPARARFLAESLGLAPDALRRADCPELARWLAGLRPRGMTLVFPEAFVDSPASMFGHTLLRIDVAEEDASANLLAFAIDFTAETRGEEGPLYLLKGVLGLYPGRFGLSPYYDKLKLYADWQSRDVWEYRLDLEPEDLELVLLHLWEMQGVDFPYFFFHDNCSYQLLRLIEVARPDVTLHDGFPLSVVPIDTVRAVTETSVFSGEVAYRPSPARELTHALAGLDRATRRLVLALAKGAALPDGPELRALAPDEAGVVLTAAYDALRWLYLNGQVSEDDSRTRSHALLVARSRLGATGSASPVPRPAVRPDEGHGTAMVSLGGGVRDDEGFLELRIRPALHDRLDTEGGFAADSTIRILDTRIRFEPRRGRVRLEELTLVEVRSEPPRDLFFEPISWHVDLGFRTRLFEDRDGDLDPELIFRTEGGLGAAVRPWGGPVKLYGMADLRVEAGDAFDENVAFGPGLTLGAELRSPADRLKGHLYGRALRFVAGDTETDLELGVEARLSLGRQTALRAGAAWHAYAGEEWLDARVGVQLTF